jgi:ubiquinone/menaquinone biosynthesis C-methylase UbiE
VSFKAFEAEGWSERAATFDTLVGRATAAAIEPLLDAAGVVAGTRVLEVGCGLGDLAAAAARRGAAVTGTDLAEGMLEAARRRHPELELVLADAEALPFDDGRFDVVLSSVGAMFAPHHRTVADELLRVTRPGGTIAMANWTPEGFIGHLFTTMAPYAPPPPPGAVPPPRWGDEQHVRELFGDRVSDIALERRTLVMEHSADPTEFREYWKRNYGPTIAVYRHIGADPARVDELDRDLLTLLTDWNRAGAPGRTAYDAEYLLVTAHRR